VTPSCSPTLAGDKPSIEWHSFINLQEGKRFHAQRETVPFEGISEGGSIAVIFLSQDSDDSSVFAALGELFDLCASQANLLLSIGCYFLRIRARTRCLWPVFGYQGRIRQGPPFVRISNSQVQQLLIRTAPL
jgi:hypothetical protein